MRKNINDEILPDNLQDFFSGSTYGEAEKKLKELSKIVRKINDLVREGNIEAVKKLINEGKSKKEISIELDIPLSTVYRYSKK